MPRASIAAGSCASGWVDEAAVLLSRIVLITRTATGYTAKVQYESVIAETPSLPTIAEALRHVAGQLQKIGFMRLRTRLNFRGKKYYAEKEPWVDYPDSA